MRVTPDFEKPLDTPATFCPPSTRRKSSNVTRRKCDAQRSAPKSRDPYCRIGESFACDARSACALPRSPAQRFIFSLDGFFGDVDVPVVLPERVVTMILCR